MREYQRYVVASHLLDYVTIHVTQAPNEPAARQLCLQSPNFVRAFGAEAFLLNELRDSSNLVDDLADIVAAVKW